MADLATCLGDSGKRVLDGLVGSAEALGAVRWPRAAAAYKGLAEPSPQGDCAVTAIAGSRTGGEHPEMPSSAIAVDWRVGVLWLFEPLASAPPRWRATAALIHGDEMIRSIRVSKECGGISRQVNLLPVANPARCSTLPWISVSSLASYLADPHKGRIPDAWRRRRNLRAVRIATSGKPGHSRGACYRSADRTHLVCSQGPGKGGGRKIPDPDDDCFSMLLGTDIQTVFGR